MEPVELLTQELNKRVHHRVVRNGVISTTILIVLLIGLVWLVSRPYNIYPESPPSIQKSLVGMRTMTIMGDTVLVPFEVPNFLNNYVREMDTYISKILSITFSTYNDPFGRDWMYYVITITLHEQNNRTMTLAIMVLDKGTHVISYIDEELLKMGSPSGTLTKSMKQPNIKRVIKLLERRQEV